MAADVLLSKYPIISDQIERDELKVILNSLEQIMQKSVNGAVVEFGCYAGTTSLFIQRLLHTQETRREFHVYDSFEGLPEKQSADQSPSGLQFKAGELAVSKSSFIHNFKKAGLPLPVIHKRWFSELTADDVPNKIAFAFLDGDYYESILTPLKLISPLLTPGALIIVDDYHNQALPGAAKAVDEWVANRSVKSFRVQSSLALVQL